MVSAGAPYFSVTTLPLSPFQLWQRTVDAYVKNVEWGG